MVTPLLMSASKISISRADAASALPMPWVRPNPMNGAAKAKMTSVRDQGTGVFMGVRYYEQPQWRDLVPVRSIRTAG